MATEKTPTKKTPTKKTPPDADAVEGAAPAAPAAPAERKLKATVRGVDVEVATSALHDWELAEAVGAVQSGDVHGQMLLPSVMRRLIGVEAYAALKQQFRDPATGRVDAESMGEALGELLVALNPNS